MNFSYTALTKDHRKKTGIINAINKDEAHHQLIDQGLTVISLIKLNSDQINDDKNTQKKPPHIKTFKFSGTDQGGQPVNGTIDALDELSAYKRLRTEYFFSIDDIAILGHKTKNEASAHSKISQLEHHLNRVSQPQKPNKTKHSLFASLKSKFKVHKSKKDFIEPSLATENTKINSFLYLEVNSFISWLLFFYIGYFYLISFSLEKEIGLKKSFAISSISNPLILNITLLLFLMHFALHIKKNYFNKNIIGTLFLTLFLISFYIYIVLYF